MHQSRSVYEVFNYAIPIHVYIPNPLCIIETPLIAWLKVILYIMSWFNSYSQCYRPPGATFRVVPPRKAELATYGSTIVAFDKKIESCASGPYDERSTPGI